MTCGCVVFFVLFFWMYRWPWGLWIVHIRSLSVSRFRARQSRVACWLRQQGPSMPSMFSDEDNDLSLPWVPHAIRTLTHCAHCDQMNTLIAARYWVTKQCIPHPPLKLFISSTCYASIDVHKQWISSLPVFGRFSASVAAQWLCTLQDRYILPK